MITFVPMYVPMENGFQRMAELFTLREPLILSDI